MQLPFPDAPRRHPAPYPHSPLSLSSFPQSFAAVLWCQPTVDSVILIALASPLLDSLRPSADSSHSADAEGLDTDAVVDRAVMLWSRGELSLPVMAAADQFRLFAAGATELEAELSYDPSAFDV